MPITKIPKERRRSIPERAVAFFVDWSTYLLLKMFDLVSSYSNYYASFTGIPLFSKFFGFVSTAATVGRFASDISISMLMGQHENILGPVFATTVGGLLGYLGGNWLVNLTTANGSVVNTCLKILTGTVTIPVTAMISGFKFGNRAGRIADIMTFNVGDDAPKLDKMLKWACVAGYLLASISLFASPSIIIDIYTYFTYLLSNIGVVDIFTIYNKISRIQFAFKKVQEGDYQAVIKAEVQNYLMGSLLSWAVGAPTVQVSEQALAASDSILGLTKQILSATSQEIEWSAVISTFRMLIQAYANTIMSWDFSACLAGMVTCCWFFGIGKIKNGTVSHNPLLKGNLEDNPKQTISQGWMAIVNEFIYARPIPPLTMDITNSPYYYLTEQFMNELIQNMDFMKRSSFMETEDVDKIVREKQKMEQLKTNVLASLEKSWSGSSIPDYYERASSLLQRIQVPVPQPLEALKLLVEQATFNIHAENTDTAALLWFNKTNFPDLFEPVRGFNVKKALKKLKKTNYMDVDLEVMEQKMV